MGTQIDVVVDEHMLKRLVLEYLSEITGLELTEKDIVIEVKTSRNYKAEWETGQFRAKVSKHLIE